jgi:hypothetical protein
MDQPKRDQRFQEHRDLMGKLLNAYQNWQGRFHPPDPSLATPIHTHNLYKGKFLKKAPKNDNEMETLTELTLLYMSETKDEVDKLSSLGTYTVKHKPRVNKYYSNILWARDNVEDWIDKVLEELNPAVSPPSALKSDNSLFIVLLERLSVTITPGTGITKKDIVDETKQLINEQSIKLTDTQISVLLDAWKQIVTAFSEDPIGKTGVSGRPDGVIDAIISFDAVQSDLEILYNQLTTNVERTTEEGLDSLLFSLY